MIYKENVLKKMLNIVFKGILYFTIIGPIVLLCIYIFVERWSYPDIMPQVFSFRSIDSVIRQQGFLKLILSSTLISVLVSIISLIIALMNSWFIFYKCKDSRVKNAVHLMAIFPFMMSATVFSLGINVDFLKINLDKTLTAVIVSHLVFSLPYSHKIIYDAFKAIGEKYYEASKSLGASDINTFLRVILPLTSPVITNALNMAFVISFSQYFTTLVMGGGNVKTLSTVIVPFLQSGERNISAIYSLVFILISGVIFLINKMIVNVVFKNKRVSYF